MIGFIIALAAGFAAPHLDESVTRRLLATLSGRMKIDPGEVRIISFMLAMLGAGLVATLLSSGTPVFIVLGGIIGYFATPILLALQNKPGGSPPRG